MHWLDERMKENGYRVCFMAEYFLPDVNALKRREESVAILLRCWSKRILQIYIFQSGAMHFVKIESSWMFLGLVLMTMGN